MSSDSLEAASLQLTEFQQQLPFQFSMLPPQATEAPASYSDDSGYDDSLTDIRWLGSMDAGVNFPSIDHDDRRLRVLGRDSKPRGKAGICKKLSYDKREEKSEVHKLRPPFSYAALISLAINSHPQKMLTLNSIYRWIETHFPFFRMPEAKAWKNSIRHNLSIKKSMFQKVYLDPPRRGNGAYWTLLIEGQEEVQRCIKLFSTLRPPVIDEQATILLQCSPSTHTVRSRGQFMPAPLSSQTVEVRVTDTTKEHKMKKTHVPSEKKALQPQGYLHKENPPHSHPPSIQPYHPNSLLPSNPSVAPTVSTSHFHDSSGSTLLDSSFLTPLKDTGHYMQEVDINTISLSPLFNFITPRNSADTRPHQHSQTTLYSVQQYSGQPASNCFSPLTPTKQTSLSESDSSMFSPLGLKFCTPIKDLTSLSDLVHPASFSTPSKDLCPPLSVQELGITPTSAPGVGSYLSRALTNSPSPLCYDGRPLSRPQN